MTPVPTILYVDCQLHIEMVRRRLAGMRRYAAARGWQVETLEHRFASETALREAIGHPPLDEILNVRLVRAMELLVHTERTISVVAGMSGFPSEWEFWHFFRKRTGMSPFRFRKERR